MAWQGPNSQMTFPYTVIWPIAPYFVREALRLGGIFSIDRLSAHDRVTCLRFVCWRINRFVFEVEFKVNDYQELLLIQDIWLGKGVHTVAPDWQI